MSLAYNERDHRAFDPPSEMKACEDVLDGRGLAYLGVACHPFGIGIYRTFSNSTRVQAMPLYYVSQAVCNNRSLVAPRVEPGWYLCVNEWDQDCEFQIRVSARTCGKWPSIKAAIGGDVALLSVFVDGTKCCKLSSVVSSLGGSDLAFHGFELFSDRSVENGYTNVRAFSFSKARVDDEHGSRVDAGGSESLGEILVKFAKGDKGPVCHQGRRLTRGEIPKATTTVSEKDAVKRGKSVHVRQDGRPLSKSVSLVPYSINNKVSLDWMGIKIRIRERVWLESRRIIDASGNPITKGLAAKLASRDAAFEAPRPMKKIKREAVVEDVIDLC